MTASAAGPSAGRWNAACNAFLDRQVDGLGGNGRACADCHMPTNSFQLSPANVEARYQSLQFRKQFDPKADDPLFRPIDADDFRHPTAQTHPTSRRCGGTD